MSNYRWLRARYKPRIFKKKNEIENGIWTPLSVAAFISGYSVQNLRLLSFQGFIKSGKFKVGPLLVQLESIEDYRENLRNVTSRNRPKNNC